MNDFLNKLIGNYEPRGYCPQCGTGLIFSEGRIYAYGRENGRPLRIGTLRCPVHGVIKNHRQIVNSGEWGDNSIFWA